MALDVPANSLKTHNSTSSLRHFNVAHEHDLTPVVRGSKRNSESSIASQAVEHPETPLEKHASHLQRPDTLHRTSETTLYADKSHRAFTAPTATLMSRSPFFNKLLKETPEPAPEQMTFESADDFSMALFAKWIQDEKSLHGPTDFHSMNHYLGLYVLARKFECEGLENHVMDAIRHHYAKEGMTASPFRLDYIYSYTQPPCLMRRFLVSTAAFRCLDEHAAIGEDGNLTAAMKASLAANTEMFADFEKAMIHVYQSDMQDPRLGPDCAWHKHEATPKCKQADEMVEPWQFT